MTANEYFEKPRQWWIEVLETATCDRKVFTLPNAPMSVAMATARNISKQYKSRVKVN